MPWVLLALGVLGLVAASQRKPRRRRPAPLPPMATEAIEEAVEPLEDAQMPGPPGPPAPAPPGAAERLQNGTPLREDLEAAADEADRMGMPSEAEAIRERAQETPSAEEVTEATAPETYEQELDRMPANLRNALNAALASSDYGVINTAAFRFADLGYPRASGRLRERAQTILREEAAAPEAPPTPPEPAPQTPTGPAGFNPSQARTLAPQVAQNIAQKRYSYSRNMLRQFQRAAGVDVDGVYGGGTRGALIFYGVTNAPRALFRPTTTRDYPANLAAAARAAMA